MRQLSGMFLHLVALHMTGAYQQKSSKIVDPPAELERIVGGSVVNPPFKYPYTAFFVSNGYKCGGTIINKNHVLTAGHCIKRRRPTSGTFVIVGRHEVNSTDAFGPDPEKVFGTSMIRVEKFIVRRDSKDIAILRLVRDIVFSSKVSAACLPGLPVQNYARMEAVTTGWGGIVGYDPGSYPNPQKTSDLLREVTLDVVEPNTKLCIKAVGDQQSYLCAYRQGKDACQGDSGGPLTIKQNGKFVVIGVVSAGSGCGAQGYAGIYTRVSHFREWIKQNVGQVCEPDSSVLDETTGPTTSAQGDCSCSSFVNAAGYGQCRKSDSDFEGSVSCYVNMPTSCTDLARSGSNPDKFLSAQACRRNPQITSTTAKPTTAQTTIAGCKCTNFVNRNGYGKCKKPDSDFEGSVSCYVVMPSSCNDLIKSGSNPDKSLSAEACWTTTTKKPTAYSTTPATTSPQSSGCSCSEFVNINGFGRCQKPDYDFGGSVSCYVNTPSTSTCSDLVRSGSNWDKFLSSEACGGKTLDSVSIPTCSCSNFVNAHGFGRCLKRHVDFGNSAMCYVNLPSSCMDLKPSQTYPTKLLSSHACTYKIDTSHQN